MKDYVALTSYWLLPSGTAAFEISDPPLPSAEVRPALLVVMEPF